MWLCCYTQHFFAPRAGLYGVRNWTSQVDDAGVGCLFSYSGMMTPSNTDYLIYVVWSAQSLNKFTQSASQYLDSIIIVVECDTELPLKVVCPLDRITADLATASFLIAILRSQYYKLITLMLCRRVYSWMAKPYNGCCGSLILIPWLSICMYFLIKSRVPEITFFHLTPDKSNIWLIINSKYH